MVAIEFIEMTRETAKNSLEHFFERADKREPMSTGERAALEDLITVLSEIKKFDNTLKEISEAKRHYSKLTGGEA